MFESNTRVIIIDDMLMMRTLLKKALKEMGFENIIEADDGTTGWEAIENANPAIELIISDWNMPNCSGLDLLKRIRATPKFAQVPFIMVTAEADPQQVTEALKAGASNYVLKPFTIPILRDKLAAVHKKITVGSW